MADTHTMPDGAGLPEPVGPRLKRAREAAGMSLPQMSDITKIPTRMLVLIEAGDFAALPARTYATGFTRTYARALGLNEADMVAAVRAELGMAGAPESQPAATFEPGDPARVPTARLAWLAALAAIVVVAAGAVLWRTYYTPAVTLPSILPEETAAPQVAPVALPEPTLSEDPLASGVPTEAATATPVVSGAVRPLRREAPRRPRPVVPTGEASGAVRLGGILPPPVPVSTGAN